MDLEDTKVSDVVSNAKFVCVECVSSFKPLSKSTVEHMQRRSSSTQIEYTAVHCLQITDRSAVSPILKPEIGS